MARHSFVCIAHTCGSLVVVPREAGRLAIEAPAGRVAVEYVQQGPRVEQVRLFNVPSYLHAAVVPRRTGQAGPAAPVHRRHQPRDVVQHAAQQPARHPAQRRRLGADVGHNTVTVDNRDPLAHGFQLT